MTFESMLRLALEGILLPNHEEHCQHSMMRYGVRGDDIHTYLDEPCRVAGQTHRQFRHDTKTVKLVGELFGPEYGRELAENIALDHITADHEEEIRNDRDSIILLKCPNCGGQLTGNQNGKSTCRYCGYEVKVPEISTTTEPGKISQYEIQDAVDKIKRKREKNRLIKEEMDRQILEANPRLAKALPYIRVAGVIVTIIILIIVFYIIGQVNNIAGVS